ncbi:nucleoside 2-deoxyribosyltransferase domain-containing protein [Herpetosiphon giganteus]|uniref:nucleoside 2-deoxyribosyltransferase domain-containing protein n=1 Tax=Herpetosiphon giganteus TaxID=2029754 RepID=UPI00195A2885|nr:nucleoside 2-deoxyribosyltransferase domain-containing protein [Herpetosiphon giganteus]MBM7844116.1 hypothetical protein [Herpetosiphon giganteus]
MAIVLKPPSALPTSKTVPAIFLAGSIEMGSAIDWQAEIAQELAADDLLLLNPRRDAWDSSWAQTINNPLFRGQVEWELDGLALADLIIIYFAPQTQSPISLLELGLFASSGKLLVCCPEGFWRKGNVDIVCARYQIPQAASLEALIAACKRLAKD